MAKPELTTGRKYSIALFEMVATISITIASMFLSKSVKKVKAILAPHFSHAKFRI
uniref:Uncharacterized protein n=1 Tax=Enterobacter sp. HP19 TaxID=1811975 RepID=A0A2H4UEH4_9ENTR|nr:hypothetical protein [Enterobacter sp. HP19]